MLHIPTYSGRHPELTTPNRLVGPIRLSSSLLSPWLDEHLPCWLLNDHAFGPLWTDPDTLRTGRDCYRCGRWFQGETPDGRNLLAARPETDPSTAEEPVLHFWLAPHGKGAIR